ncbi:MAG: iron-containing alcohol dehydrogenase [Sedimentisphaerales bacterium]|nr:iron-containing alcohol dehydrogenase [Sedimentisphaerales bacterium]
MSLEGLLDTTFDCECGRRHNVPVKRIIYSEDALERLPEVLSSIVSGRRIVLTADNRTWDIAGCNAEKILERAGWSTEHIIVPDIDHGNPVCNEKTYDWLSDKLPSADIALAVGSGVINDLTKWVAFDRDLPYAVFATAATMNGYTAANVAPTLKGVKSLIRTRPPIAVFAIPSMIVEAPFELTASGLGDTLAKPVSTADWIFNHIFFDEYFCRYCSEMINTLEPYYFDHPEDIKNRQPDAIEALFKALLYSGIAMTLVGTSAPASGGEHLLSHTLDMMTSVDGVAHDLHGRQVGLGTLFSSAIYDRIFRIEDTVIHASSSDIDTTFWGPLAESVSRQYEQKQPLLQILREKLTDGQAWRAFLDAGRDQVRPPDQIKHCLRTAGAAHTFKDIGCSHGRLRDAILHMHEIRKRPTVIDLAWILGILPGAADEIIDQWLTT